MSNRETSTTVGVNGEIEANVYDISIIRQQFDDWESLSKQEKYDVLKCESPVETVNSCNVTTTNLHEYIVRDLHPNKTSSADNISATHAGIGDDAASGTSSSDNNLNNLLVSKELLDHVANGKTLDATFLLESTDANQKTIDEIGIASGDLNNVNVNDDVFLLNHASFTPIEKNNKNSITFTVKLTFDNS